MDPYQLILVILKNFFVSTTCRPASALFTTPVARAAAQTSRSTRTWVRSGAARRTNLTSRTDIRSCSWRAPPLRTSMENSQVEIQSERWRIKVEVPSLGILSLSAPRRRCRTSQLQDPSPPSFKCNVLRQSLTVDSQNIPCATLKRRGRG